MFSFHVCIQLLNTILKSFYRNNLRCEILHYRVDEIIKVDSIIETRSLVIIMDKGNFQFLRTIFKINVLVFIFSTKTKLYESNDRCASFMYNLEVKFQEL
jgi:hypothetical protein